MRVFARPWQALAAGILYAAVPGLPAAAQTPTTFGAPVPGPAAPVELPPPTPGAPADLAPGALPDPAVPTTAWEAPLAEMPCAKGSDAAAGPGGGVELP